TRPAIIVKQNSVMNTRAGIDDRMMGEHDKTGVEYFATYWVGSHTLFAIGANGTQVGMLASEVQRELTEFASVIRSELGLHQFRVLQLGDMRLLEESQQNWTCPVTVGYAYEERWKLRQRAPRI